MFSALKSFLDNWTELGNYKKLPAESRRLTVYSEGSQDWPHLGPMLRKFLELKPDAHVAYLSSDQKDPGRLFDHPRFHFFNIGSGTVRTIFFKTVESPLVLMSLPDLNVYELKKSSFPVHYIYAFHSINSTHTVYRERAFEFFDTILCVGPHHVQELRQEESLKGMAPRRLLEHGSVKLDTVIERYADSEARTKGQVPFVLLAPSWGECSFAEDPKLIRDIVNGICQKGWSCSLRLHPMTVRHHPELAKELLQEFSNFVSNGKFAVETDMNDNSSLMKSDLMLSDWSGAATEYAFALMKPVLFIDTPQKLNNPRSGEFSDKGLEDLIRHEIGGVVKPADVPSRLVSEIELLMQNRSQFEATMKACRQKWIYHVGRSAEAGAAHLVNLYGEFVK